MRPLEEVLGVKGRFSSSFEHVGIVRVDTDTQYAAIEIGGAKLEYGYKQEYENPTLQFLEDAVLNHEKYGEFFEKERELFLSCLKPYADAYSEAEMFRHNLSGFDFKVHVFQRLLAHNIRSLVIGRKRLKPFLDERLEECDNKAIQIGIGRNIVAYGLGSMEEAFAVKDFPDDIREWYAQLIEVCKGIVWMYNNTLMSYMKQRQQVDKFYEIFLAGRA